MEIYLVRHAEALERREGLAEEVRHLTAKGRKQAAKQARRLKKAKVRPDLIMTSPFVRAVQTAELLAAQIGKDAVVAAHGCLSIDVEPEEGIKMIRSSGKLKSIMLVGHEPHLSKLAAAMLGYEQVSPLHKGGCLAISWNSEKTDNHASFNWYLQCGRKMQKSARKALARKG